ncbi:hypothetical protein GLOIN_2v1790940 [Rhizophagus irregularis DAOM 181602=DAOM 197198]|uniref:Uncharacterized protein n=2 Tax=Rhizophagus irregularis TaxID=588596 RepID=A0A015IX38_RHIIW|nr:hypothetical protein RirG_193620 [Rhizophagus irregularis DAOM 197198w]GBC22769.2 hypothetical protein GLOIN_2v1790940 [Rhizophagus irregularis DAOM 181602=DAOM 197198]
MEDAVMNVELHAIVSHAPITIHYDNSNNRHSIKIQEILYKYNGRWKLRDVKYSYQHPSEFAPLDEPETHLPIYKLFIDLYYDDFGTFRNIYHSLGGVYVQIGNMLFTERNRLKNHFVLGFVPFGGSFDKFIKPFITEMKVLERGKILNIQGNKCVIIASLGDTTADLPQGNDMAGVKRHSANRGYQTCNVTKESLTSNDLDLHLISRYHHLSDKQFKEISEASTITERKAIASEFGLQLYPPLLDQLKRERHLQSPQDVYHLTAGKAPRLFKITIEALSPKGKSEFIRNWKYFEYPKTWRKLPNPISHIDSFMMSDCLELTMMIPFILNRFLRNTHFKNSELALFQRRTGVTRSDLAIKLWLKCWVVMAKMMAMVFKDSFTKEEYSELRECLCNERVLLSQAFKDFENLPNLHTNFHLLLHAKNYATLLNTNAGTKEMIHRIFKNIVPRTNLKNVSLDLLKHYTTLFAIRHLLDGGIDLRLSTSNGGFMNLPKHLRRLMSNWFITKDNVDIKNDAEEVCKVCSPDDRISNILLKKWVLRRNVEMPLLVNINEELKLAYEDFRDNSAIPNSMPLFFEYASFIFENERDNTILRRLRIGMLYQSISKMEAILQL